MPVRASHISAFDRGKHPSAMVLPIEEDARFSMACLRPLEARIYNRVVHRRIIRVELIQSDIFVG